MEHLLPFLDERAVEAPAADAEIRGGVPDDVVFLAHVGAVEALQDALQACELGDGEPEAALYVTRGGGLAVSSGTWEGWRTVWVRGARTGAKVV